MTTHGSCLALQRGLSSAKWIFFYFFPSQTALEEQTGERVDPFNVGSVPSRGWNAFVCVVPRDSCIYVCLNPLYVPTCVSAFCVCVKLR